MKFSKALRNGSINDVFSVLPYVPGNVIDINIMNVLNCCYKASDIVKLLNFFVESKYYISSYAYECIIITAGRIGDSRLVSTLYEAAVKKNGNRVSLRDALLHAYRVCDAHQKVISVTYGLFSENSEISSIQYEDILRTLIIHSEYDSLCVHIVGKMQEQQRFLSLPVLSILLNSLGTRSPSLAIQLINQTRFHTNDKELLNVILSREMTKCSEQKNPQGMLLLYCEMQRRGILVDDSEASRLKRCIHTLMKQEYEFHVAKSDDVFTRLWSECWLEDNGNECSRIDDFVDRIKHSERSRIVELTALLKHVGFAVSSHRTDCVASLGFDSSVHVEAHRRSSHLSSCSGNAGDPAVGGGVAVA